MSDLSGIVDSVSNGQLSSEDVEMTDHKVDKGSEEQESDGKEQEMDDLFGNEAGDHGNFARFVSPQFAQKNQPKFRI